MDGWYAAEAYLQCHSIDWDAFLANKEVKDFLDKQEYWRPWHIRSGGENGKMVSCTLMRIVAKITSCEKEFSWLSAGFKKSDHYVDPLPVDVVFTLNDVVVYRRTNNSFYCADRFLKAFNKKWTDFTRAYTWQQGDVCYVQFDPDWKEDEAKSGVFVSRQLMADVVSYACGEGAVAAFRQADSSIKSLGLGIQQHTVGEATYGVLQSQYECEEVSMATQQHDNAAVWHAINELRANVRKLEKK